MDTPQIESVIQTFLDRVPFCADMGLQVMAVNASLVSLSYQQQAKHVGNYVLQTLHGGAIAALIDTVGAIMCLADTLRSESSGPGLLQDERFARSGTIDLRVDYLRPAMGKAFLAQAELVRRGKRVAVTRMQLFDEKDELVSIGTGTYLIGSPSDGTKK